MVGIDPDAVASPAGEIRFDAGEQDRVLRRRLFPMGLGP